METELNNKKDKFKYFKITAIICLIAAVLSFAGCGGVKNDSSSSAPKTAGSTIIKVQKEFQKSAFLSSLETFGKILVFTK